MVSPLFFIREVCLFVAKLVQNFFFFLSCRTRGATVKFVQLNAIKLNDPGIIRADNRSSRTNKRRISRAYTYPILRKLCAQAYSNLFLCTFHEIIARNIFSI